MMTNQNDNPGVIALPPLIALVTFLSGIALDWLVPIGAVNAMLSPRWRVVVAVVLFLMACWTVFRAVRTFNRAGTPYDVRKPAVALAASDIFSRTRNPMYEAFAFLLLALAIGFASDWTALLLVPWALVMHFGVVRREERYLEQKFGDEYRRYRAQVPRYGWPF